MARQAGIYLPLRGISNAYLHLMPHLATKRDGRSECGNPACSGSRLGFLKDRRRPAFEGRWACSTQCLEAMVHAAARRDFDDAGLMEAESEHRHRVPLGLILLARGWITKPQLQHALETQRRAGRGPIGHWLMVECGLTQEHLLRSLSMQWRCPALTLDGFDPQAMARVVPRALVEKLGIVPVRIAGKRILYVAFAGQPDASAAFAVERMSGLKVESGLVKPVEWNLAQQLLCKCDFISSVFEPAVDIAAMSSRIASVLAKMQPRASRLVKVHQFYWLRMWLEDGAMTAREGGIPATGEDVVDRLYSLENEQ